MLIDTAHIKCAWDGDFRPKLDQPLGKFQRGVTHVKRAIDMCGFNIDQLACVENASHANDDAHRHLGSRPVRSIELGLI